MSDTSGDAHDLYYDTGIHSLQDEGDFYSWKSIITLHFRRLGFWDIVSGQTPRPDESTPEVSQGAWERDAMEAKFILYRHVSVDINEFLYPYDTAPAMWAALMRRFHRQDAPSILLTFRAICALHYTESSDESIPDYLATFDRHWNTLVGQTADAGPPFVGPRSSLATTLGSVVRSEESKIEFLIGSLPETIRRMAISLQIRHGEEVKYMHIWQLLMRLHGLQESDDREAALALAQRLDCSWCRSRGFESVGHHWKRCDKLREFKRENGRENGKERREQKEMKRRGRV